MGLFPKKAINKADVDAKRLKFLKGDKVGQIARRVANLSSTLMGHYRQAKN